MLDFADAVAKAMAFDLDRVPRKGPILTFIPSSLYDAAVAACLDVSVFVKTRPLPVSKLKG